MPPVSRPKPQFLIVSHNKQQAMLIDFFYTLRAAGLAVSVPEYLSLIACLHEGVLGPRAEPIGSMEDFYHLCRTTLIKDEKHYDKFDRAFAAYFQGVKDHTQWLDDFMQSLAQAIPLIPAEWLRKNQETPLSPQVATALQALSWEELMRTLQARLQEQKERHEGGNKWIGTGGTSPFGAYGQNPTGIRMGQAGSRHRSAVKVWDQRHYRDYDDGQTLQTRNLQMALRRLRKFAREGAKQKLDLAHTIDKTAANAGLLDIRLRAERHNNVKVLLLMDVGGTMDEHIAQVEALFGAVKAEFKHLAFFYFHNCVYDFLWKHNERRYAEPFPTWDILRKYNKDYKLIFVGDATMSPYEILQAGGSVEYNNAEAGVVWLTRLTEAFPKFAWLNPEPQGLWPYRQSVGIIAQIMGGQMYPLTLGGLEEAVRHLSH